MGGFIHVLDRLVQYFFATLPCKAGKTAAKARQTAGKDDKGIGA